MVKRRNRKLSASVDYGLLGAPTGVHYYRTTLSNSFGYTDGFASSIWPMGTNVSFDNSSTNTGGDFGELNKLNYDNVIELYTPDVWQYSASGSFLSGTISDATAPFAVSASDGLCSGSQTASYAPYASWGNTTPVWRTGYYNYTSSLYSPLGDRALLQEGKEGYVEFEFTSSADPGYYGTYPAYKNRGLQLYFQPSGTMVGGCPKTQPTTICSFEPWNWQNSGAFGLTLGDVFIEAHPYRPTYFMESTTTGSWLEGDGVGDTYAAWFSGTLAVKANDDYSTCAYGILTGPGRRLYGAAARTSSLNGQKFRVGRWLEKYRSNDGSGRRLYDRWVWKWQMQQSSGSCWETFATAALEDIEAVATSEWEDANSILTRSYAPIIDFTVVDLNRTSSAIFPKVVNLDTHLWTRSQYSAWPTASLNYCYPSGFLTNPAQPYRTDIYKDYGLMWNVATDRLRVRGESRYPWFNSYEDYSDDIRFVGKDYSILPEFCISKEIDNILVVGDVQDNFGFLTLEGASITSSGGGFYNTTPGLGINADFFEDYCDSDFLQDFGMIVNDHANISPSFKPEEFSISCDAILKLLPYEGFYPIQRTAQLGTIFNDSINVFSAADGYNVELFYYDNDTQCWQEIVDGPFATEGGGDPYETYDSEFLTYHNHPQYHGVRAQSIATPLFGPGVLYNSIKSGIGVGWTIVTGSNLQDVYKMWDTSRPVHTTDPQSHLTWTSSSVLEHRFLNTCIYQNPDVATKIPFEALWSLSKFPQANLTSDLKTAGAFHANYPEALDGIFTATSSYDCFNPGLSTPNTNFMVRAREISSKGLKYELAMNNFLAESVRFFLEGPTVNSKQGELTDFISLDAQTVKDRLPIVGNTYYMDIVLSMDSGWTMCESYWNGRDTDSLYYNQFAASSSQLESVYNYGPQDFGGPGGAVRQTAEIVNFSCSFNGRYFGPATQKWSNYWNESDPVSGAHYNVCDPAQAPFTPPYYYGPSRLTLKYTPGDEWSNLNQDPFVSMFDRITASYSNPTLDRKMSQGNINNVLGGGTLSKEYFAYRMAQNVGDSIVWEATINNPITTVETATTTGGGVQTSTVQSNLRDPSTSRWIIYPKWECPVLDFSSQALSTIAIGGGLHPTCSVADNGGFLDNTPIGLGRGMWSGYGKLGPYDEGLKITITETPGKPTVSYDNSLANLMGFTDLAQDSVKTLGKLATTRTLAEGVVAIPYVEVPQVDENSDDAWTTGYHDSYHQTFNSKFFFRIPVDKAFDGDRIRDDQNDHLSELLVNMQKFILPPQFDFIKNRSPQKPPIVMYLFPFETQLLQTDLQDIWQGVLPDIGVTAKKMNVTIDHGLTVQDPFYRGKNIPPSVRWMVFKVKKKGEGYYADVTKNLGDESRASEAYTYNWPYDFCSLIELGKIQTSFKIKK